MDEGVVRKAGTGARDQVALEQLRLLESEQPGLMKELIRLFVADAPRQMRLVASAYARRDPEGLRQSAHFLRSGSLALGLTCLAEATRAFEQLDLGEYGSEQSDQLIEQLRRELHAVLLVLLRELQGS